MSSPESVNQDLPTTEVKPVRLRATRKPAISPRTMTTLERIRLTVLSLVLIGLAFYAYRTYQRTSAVKEVYSVLEMEDSNRALNLLRDIEQKWGTNGETYFLRGRAHRLLGNIDLADKAFNQASLEDYNNARLQHERALLDVQWVLPEITEEQVQSILDSLQADFADNATALAKGMLRLNEFQNVAGVLGLWKTVEPESYRLDYLTGLTANRISEFDDALESFEKSYAKQPDYVPVWLELGSAYWRKNDPEKAYQFFDKYLTARPESAEAEGGRIETLLAIGRYEEVDDYFEKNNPELDLNSRARIFRAQAYEGLERYEDVIRTLKPLVEVWSEDTEANQMLAVAYRATGNDELAAKFATQAQESITKQNAIAPLRSQLSANYNDAVTHAELGHLLMTLVSRLEGMQHLNIALSLDPTLIVAHEDMLRYYVAGGEAESADMHRQALEQLKK